VSNAAWCRRLLSGDETVRQWYAGGPYDFEAALARRRARPAATPAPADIAEWRGWLEAHGASPEALANLARLALPGAVCVVAGQQPGLFGGPLYCLVKALAAARWASRIEAETGVPCVPVFWIASDDHDFAEAATAAWLDREGVPRRVAIGPIAGRAGAPLHDLAVPREAWATATGELLASLHRSDLTAALEALLAPAGDDTFEAHFARLVLRMTAPFGVVPVVPRLGFLRRAGAALAAEELAAPRAMSERLRAAGEQLAALGCDVIHREGNEANVFLETGEPGARVRARLAWDGARLAATHPATREPLGVFSPEAILADPARLSPNAALRPLVQDAALPTVMFIGGPSEVAYHAQIGGEYAAFGVCRPAVTPRPTVVLLEPRVRRALGRLGIAAEEAASLAPDALAARLASTGGGDGVGADALARSIGDAVERWLAEAGADGQDAAVQKAIERLRDSVRIGTEKVAGRLADARARRASTGEAAKRKALDALAPFGKPQDRVLSPVAPLLANFGAEGVRKVYGCLSLEGEAPSPVTL
jgi:bacillithiol biosynthesis cysteine-adding enzyme BshC